jgi:aspartyl-tRNA(Asn)/glutamyl-tRNA(Gln) amidotransferase subunit A
MSADRVTPGRADALAGATIAAVAAALRAGEVTSAALVDACLERIAAQDPAINAFITVFADDARAQAAQADREMASGRYRGALHGVPISLKDLIDLRGTRTTAGSQVRAEHLAAADAVAAARLREAGAIFVGKTNLHEFAFGTTSEDSAFGPVRHPADPGRSPGGSSGGSAASVLAHMAYASVGTDTGGSVRIPAAACGLVGLKPALHEIPTDGVVPLSHTLDHVGPIARSVEDAALLHHVMAGTKAAAASVAVEGLRLGVLKGYFTAQLDAQVSQRFETACSQLANAGATLDEVALPSAGDIAPIYLHIVLAEAAAYHAKTLESRPDDYTPPVRIRLEMGRYIMAEDYVRALRGRDVLKREIDAALHGRHALLLPSLAIPAPKLGTTTVRVGGADEPIRNVMLRLTQPFNISGHPALSIPCGSTIEGLPIGLQLAGGATGALLDVGRAVEACLGPGTSR